MKKNYSAWNITYDDFFAETSFLGKLTFLSRFGILAPSTHNSQPWKLVITENTITVAPDISRALPVSDPSFRHLYISLGCVVENIMTAADYYGLRPQVTYLKKNDLPQDMMAIQILFSEPAASRPAMPPEKHLISAIPNRRSNRNKYSSRQLSDNVIEELKKNSSHSVQINVVIDESKKMQIADLLMESRIQAFSHPDFRKEMAGYKRHDFTRSFTGMPGFTMGMDPITSLFSSFFIRHFNVMKWIRHGETDLLKKYTAAFVVVSSDRHTTEGWIESGRVMEHLLLAAQYHGVQTSLSALPPNVDQLQKILGISVRPEMFVRMGYAEDIPEHSPRFLLGSVTA